MAKETFYFSHDYHARADKKMIRMMAKIGVQGVGIYWCLIEMLYEEGGYINLSECDLIASELRTKCERIKVVIEDYNLFKNDGERFWSDSVLDRLNLRKQKSDKAKKSAKKRWSQKSENKPVNANALRTQSKGNAIKESKVKEIYISLDVALNFFKQTRTLRQLAEKYHLADVEDRFIEFYNLKADLEFKNKTKEDIVAYFANSLPNTLANERMNAAKQPNKKINGQVVVDQSENKNFFNV